MEDGLSSSPRAEAVSLATTLVICTSRFGSGLSAAFSVSGNRAAIIKLYRETHRLWSLSDSDQIFCFVHYFSFGFMPKLTFSPIGLSGLLPKRMRANSDLIFYWLFHFTSSVRSTACVDHK